MGRRTFNNWTRWIHIYLSMFSFGALLFFAVTGITLNHPSWIDDQQKVEMVKGNIDPAWVAGNDTLSVTKPEIVEYFRDNHNIRSHLTEFRIDDSECSLSFDGPGYTAYGIIDRPTGSYELIVTTAGFIAFLNDLHKGHDTGSKWNVLIDITAIMLIVVSLTGFIMILFITKNRSKGQWVAVLGAVTFVLLCLIFV
jgi:hypothetical protein